MDELFRGRIIEKKISFRRWMSQLNAGLKMYYPGIDILTIEIQYPRIVIPYKKWFEKKINIKYLIHRIKTMLESNK